MHVIDISIVAFYLIATLVMGFYYGQKTKDLKEFAVGQRNFSTTIIFTSIFATFTGSNNILGWSQRVYTTGMIFVILTFGYGTYKLLVVRYIVPRLQAFRECITVGDILAKHYGRFGRFIGGFLGFTKCAMSISGQITGLGLVITYFFDVDKYYSTGIVTLVVIFYSSYGGIKSVALTDFVQFLILIVAIPLVAAYTVYYAGGYEVVMEKALFSPNFSTKDTYTILALFVLSIFSSFNPIILQRLLMSSNLKNAGTAFKLSAFANVPFAFIIALMAGGAYVLNDSDLPPKYAALYAIGKTLPVGLKGFVVAGLLAIMMSTIDSFINTASVLFTRDMYGAFTKNTLSSKGALRVAQFTSVTVGTAAYIISMFFENIFDVYLFSLTFWVPVILMPLYGVVFKYYTSRFVFALAGLSGLATFWLMTSGSFMRPVCLIVASAVSALVFYHRGLIQFFATLPTVLEKRIQRLFKKSCSLLSQTGNQAKKAETPQFLLRELPEVQMGFAIAAFMCFFSAYFVSFSTDIIVNIVRFISTAMGLVYLVRMFFPIRTQHFLMRHAALFYIFCGIFGPVLLYLFEPSQGSLIVAALFFLSSALLFSVRTLLLSLGITVLVALIFSSHIPHDDVSFFIPATLTLFFAGSFGAFARKGIQSRFNTLNALACGIAHELRTPLASIHLNTLNAQKMLEAQETAQAKEILGQIQTTAVNATETMNLSLYGLKTTLMQASLTPLKLKETVIQLIDAYPFSADQKEVLTVNLEIDSVVTVQGNTLLLKAILHNLIKNALESLAEKGLSETSKITLTVSMKDGHQVEIRVHDTGVGIPHAISTKVFDEQLSTKPKGSGIGLSFSYNAAQYMYGDLYCYSEPGQWAEFILRLPIEAASMKKAVEK